MIKSKYMIHKDTLSYLREFSIANVNANQTLTIGWGAWENGDGGLLLSFRDKVIPISNDLVGQPPVYLFDKFPISFSFPTDTRAIPQYGVICRLNGELAIENMEKFDKSELIEGWTDLQSIIQEFKLYIDNINHNYCLGIELLGSSKSKTPIPTETMIKAIDHFKLASCFVAMIENELAGLTIELNKNSTNN